MIVATSAELVVQSALDALALGSLYALFALGIAFIFGIMQLVNFAHGELIMAGGYVLVLFTPIPLPVRIALVVLIVVCLAVMIERVAFRPLRSATPATLLVTSFAVSFLLQNLAILFFGALPRTTNVANVFTEFWQVGSVSISKLSVIIVITTLAILALLAVFLKQSSLGVRMRAAAENLEMTRLLGVRANLVVITAFAISGVLAAIAVLFLVAQTGTVSPTIGLNAVLFAFIASVIGGLGSLSGAIIGGYVLGGITVGLQVGLPLEVRPYRDALVFAIVIGILVIRPHGLLRTPSLGERV